MAGFPFLLHNQTAHQDSGKMSTGNEEIVHRQISCFAGGISTYSELCIRCDAGSDFEYATGEVLPARWQRHIPFIIGYQLCHHLPKLQACIG